MKLDNYFQMARTYYMYIRLMSVHTFLKTYKI